MEPISLFVGADQREAVGLQVFSSSVWNNASVPVSITPISHPALSDGTNAFTLSRFLVPYYQSYLGWAIWADGSDMLCLADIAELWELQDSWKAVQVVKHDYKTRHPVKYLGQNNYDYERKNWSSLMLINCAHFGWRNLNPESVRDMYGSELHRFNFLNDEHIGELPPEWNVIVGEPNQASSAKIAHYSIGLPCWYPDCDYADEWFTEQEAMLYFQEWKR